MGTLKINIDKVSRSPRAFFSQVIDQLTFKLQYLTPKGSDMRFSPFGLRSELACGAKYLKLKRELCTEISRICQS